MLFLLVPPLGILVALRLAGISYPRIIQVIVFGGGLSLGFWGGAGWAAGAVDGWALVGSVGYGFYRWVDSPSAGAARTGTGTFASVGL